MTHSAIPVTDEVKEAGLREHFRAHGGNECIDGSPGRGKAATTIHGPTHLPPRFSTGQEKVLRFVYLTSFIHREDLFNIAERWFCGRLHPHDALRLTQILICDGFIVGETLKSVTKLLLETVHNEPFEERRIHLKGELRDAICQQTSPATPRVEELIRLYRNNPDFYYREAIINGVMCLDAQDCLIGLYRLKRPRRIAEKANRHVANLIFRTVQNRAQKIAEERARNLGIPIDQLLTPEKEMVRDFIRAEEAIAQSFKEGSIRLDRAALSIHDVGGIKIVANPEKLAHLETILAGDPTIRIVDRENHQGEYQANHLVLEVGWDPEHACRQFTDCRCWEKYLNRGIPEGTLRKGLEPLLGEVKSTLNIELILSTFPDMMESELGNSIHEERIRAQRNNSVYKGYIAMNVEFLIEYLLALGFSPQVHIDRLPIKLWGRYLPDTVISCIYQLHNLPEYDFFY